MSPEPQRKRDFPAAEVWADLLDGKPHYTTTGSRIPPLKTPNDADYARQIDKLKAMIKRGDGLDPVQKLIAENAGLIKTVI